MNKSKLFILITVILIIISIIIITFSTNVLNKQKTITIAIIDSNMSKEYISKYNISTIMNNCDEPYNAPTHADMVVDVIKNTNENCEIILGNVINDDMSCDISSVINALNWLNEFDVDIICMSITTINNNPELEKIIKDFISRDIIIVAACLNYSTLTTYPAAYDNVISVANCYNENATISITDTKLKNKFKYSHWGECSTSILTAYITGEISNLMSREKFNITSYIDNYK